MVKTFQGAASPSIPSAINCLELVGFSKTRPVIGLTGRVSRGPPLRPIATIGGGGSNPALKRMRWTGSDGWAPTDSQYLRKDKRKTKLDRDRAVRCFMQLFILLRYDRHQSYQKASANEKSISFPASAKLTILTMQT